MDDVGRFVWYELLTTDPAAAERFYTSVVGWAARPFGVSATPEAAGMPPYTVWTRGGTQFGGMMQLSATAVAVGARPHWMGYVFAADVDAAHAAAVGAGGRSLVAPADIPQVGRFAVLQDADGALFAPFKPLPRQAPLESEPSRGAVAWRELGSGDAPASLRFYGGLFGWEEVGRHEMGEAGTYLLFGQGGVQMGGMFATPGPKAWLYYFDVADLDAAVAAVREHGGQLQLGPMDVPGGGRIANCLDPQGAAFALHWRPA